MQVDEQQRVIASPTCRAWKRAGRCYELSWLALLDLPTDTPWRLVHGIVNGPPETPRVGHAWLRCGEAVFDPVLNEKLALANLNELLGWAYYEAKVCAVVIAEYSRHEAAAAAAVESGHHGPWHDEPVVAVESSRSAMGRRARLKGGAAD
jgi:hypothetical protein